MTDCQKCAEMREALTVTQQAIWQWDGTPPCPVTECPCDVLDGPHDKAGDALHDAMSSVIVALSSSAGEGWVSPAEAQRLREDRDVARAMWADAKERLALLATDLRNAQAARDAFVALTNSHAEALHAARAEIERLTMERDESREQVAKWEHIAERDHGKPIDLAALSSPGTPPGTLADLREWAKAHGWDDVECIECELGRDCEKHPGTPPTASAGPPTEEPAAPPTHCYTGGDCDCGFPHAAEEPHE